ncbi:fungal-specific transcription factor domain-containing protein [Aspergillus spinulosporus]
MDKDTENRPASSAARQGQRPRKVRTRISTACTRCQKRKIRCDALLPTCTACKRAGVPCIGGGASRDYVADLETRIKWLESIIQEHLPSIDLAAGPGPSPNIDGVIPNGDWNPPQRTQQNRETRDVESPSEISDQIGLISITTGTDLRYLGPSSGLFFTKFVLAGLGKRLHADKNTIPGVRTDSLAVPSDLLVPQPKELPSDVRHTRWLSQAYFDIVHLQFPILHEPSHWETVEKIYADAEVAAVHEFQVLVVIAIGASILSRRTKVPLSAEGYFASAMKLVDGVMKTSSVGVAQCILLVQMYALNNPTSGLSLWTLHYHGLALAIELGLHRNVPASNFTPLEREVRRRIFWCTYTIDRLLSTLMGRPMGVVDEQCDLNTDHPKPRQNNEPLTNMTSAVHLFKLARFNSEIKCVLYCVDRQYPPYTQPAVTDAESWKVDILIRLRQWREDIPKHSEASTRHYINLLSEIKYHELVMLVLRPNPRFQNPDKASLRECFSSAMTCSELYHQLYIANSLHFGWISVHSLFLCLMVMFYCVWTPQGIAEETDLDSLMRALKASSDVLSAMGEYWPEAKRSRDVLDRVLMATIRRFTRHSSTIRSSSISSGLQGSMAITSFLPSDNTGEGSYMDLPSNRAPPLQNEDAGVGDDLFGFNYGDPETSFMSADVLSHFLGSGTDVIMGDSYDFEQLGDREALGWFGESLRDFGRPC